MEYSGVSLKRSLCASGAGVREPAGRIIAISSENMIWIYVGTRTPLY